MADATEDLLRPTTSLEIDVGDHSQQIDASDTDSDNDDLPPDFLNLGRTTKDKKSRTGAPPKRGTKDFEANQTRLQSRTLEASRQAMWEALGVTRVHHPTTFKTEKRRAKRRSSDAARPEEDRHTSISALDAHEAPEAGVEQLTKVAGNSGTPIGIYQPSTGQTYISPQNRRGKLFDTIGRDQSGGGVSLYPEEALWALEGSKLDVRYPRNYFDDYSDTPNGPLAVDSEPMDTQQDSQDPMGDSGIPLSLQGAHAAYIGCERTRSGRLTLEKYQVYAALKRLGYVVQRAPEWAGPGLHQILEPFVPHTLGSSTTLTDAGEPTSNHTLRSRNSQDSVLTRLQSLLLGSTHDARSEPSSQRTARRASGPLVQPGLYRTYSDIFRLLSLIPSNDPMTTPAPVPPRIVISHHRDSSSSRSVTLGGILTRSRSPSRTREPAKGHVNGSARRGSSTLATLDTDHAPFEEDKWERVGGTPVREQAIDDSDEHNLHTFRTVWNVLKPAGASDRKFKKSAPPPPDFRICVVSARESGLPTLDQMEGLFGEQVLQPSPAHMHQQQKPRTFKDAGPKRPESINNVYKRLQHGYKNIILAVVDEGIVSYVKMADAAFARERVYERTEYQPVAGTGGGKGGGGGRGGRGGRGRGRGRGRG